MIESFGNREAQIIFEDGRARHLPTRLLKRAILLLDVMDNVDSLDSLWEMAFPPDIRLHKLKGNRKGRFAIDIHKIDGWRITFEFQNQKFSNVKIENYH